MDTPPLILLDDRLGRWGPLTDRRPVFALRTGALTTRKRIERVLGRPAAALGVPDRLARVAQQREAAPVNRPEALDQPSYLVVSGRYLGLDHAEALAALPRGRAAAQPDGQLVAAHLDLAQARAALESGSLVVPGLGEPVPLPSAALADRPWHILDRLDRALASDLDALGGPTADPAHIPGLGTTGRHPIRIHPGARVLPQVVINTDAGPVTIDADALVHPFCVLEGPCYIGPRSVLAAHTAIRPWTVIGPECKVGGEVSASILYGYTNKAHLGYLGNAQVGAWANLGADTNVSNLKNTYGPVRVQLDADHAPEDTARQFHGPILGDFVRTAIGTRLPTGCVIGTGCMLACEGFAPKYAAPMGFYTPAGRAEQDMDKFLATADHIVSRRSRSLTPADHAVLRRLAAGRR